MRYLFLLLSLCSWSASAEITAPELLADQPMLGVNPPTNSKLITPNPSALTADWWRYFEADPKDMKVRTETVIRQLNSIVQALPEDQREDANTRVKRIHENLRALVELRKTAAPEASAARPALSTYTFRQWLEKSQKRRTLQAELESETEDYLRDEKRYNAAQQRFDTLTAAYLALPGQSRNKIAQGLVLMDLKANLAVNGERLRLQKATLSFHQTQLKQIVEENTDAQNKLLVNAVDIQRLNLELETAERELKNAQDSAIRLAASAVPGNIDTEAGKARTLLFEQQIKQSLIKETIADTVITRKKLELALAQFLTAPESVRLSDLREQLRDNTNRIAEVGNRIGIWHEEATRDQGRTGKSLAALFGAAIQQSGELIKLTQQRLTEVQNTLLYLQRLESEIQDARLIANHLQTLIIDKEGSFKSGFENVKLSTIKAWEQISEQLGTSLFKIGETPVTTLGILRVVLIVTLAWALSHFVRRGLTHLSTRQRGSSTFLYTLGRLAHYLILTIGISIGLSSIGVDLSNFALIAGALSLGIGFGLQAIVSNFVSGLIILFERSLRIGDFVELSSGLAGEVRAINVRSTLVTTSDMVEILVPNSEFVNGKVINWTLTDASRRIHIPFGVAYGSDKELVRRAALEAAGQTVHTLTNRREREPEVWLTNFGDSSLDFELVVWVQPLAVKKPQSVRAAYYWELETALRKYGIEIPFPQRDLHLRSGLKNIAPEIRAVVQNEQQS
jgi:potassium-dependent mechanosensitive channel